jgi:ribonuclease BN (tRNA processing enzyme)
MPKLDILRAGTPTPLKQRWGSAYVLEIDGDVVMIDCGPAATHQLVAMDHRPRDVTHLFFTHHHSDHSVDYPCLFLFRWDQCTGDEPPLRVFGPPPTEAITERLFGDDGIHAGDIAARINSVASQYCHRSRGGSLPRPGPKYEVTDKQSGDSVNGNGWTATCAEVDHMQPWLTTLAWRFDWEGGSLAFTSDTARCNALLELISGVGTLVANVTHRQERMDPDEATCIFATGDVAAVARDAQPDRLVLSHLTPSLLSDREGAVADIAEVYDGEILFADELTTIEV